MGYISDGQFRLPAQPLLELAYGDYVMDLPKERFSGWHPNLSVGTSVVEPTDREQSWS